MLENNNQLLVGAAKAALTYPEGFFPHRSFRGRYFEGSLEDIYVRAVIVKKGASKVVFIGVEAGDVGAEWLDEIAALVKTPKKNIFLTASHTHAAPHMGGYWPEDVVDAEMGRRFQVLCLKHIKEAVREADLKLEPARACYGITQCDINVNRDFKYSGTDDRINVPYIQAPNPDGISDKNVYIIEFKNMADKTLACIFNYAIHSNVTFFQVWGEGEGMLINGDIAGRAMKYVEERSKKAVAIFTMGAAADQSPRYIANHRIFDKDGNVAWEYYGRSEGIALMDAQASVLGSVVYNAIQSGHMSDLCLEDIKAATIELKLNSKIEGAKIKKESVETENDYAYQYKENISDDFDYIENGIIEMPIFMLSMGKLLFIGIPAEIVTKIGQHIRESVWEMIGVDTVIFSQCNNAYSYITDDEGYQKKTFEGLASHFMPGTEEKIIAGIRKLIKKFETGD